MSEQSFVVNQKIECMDGNNQKWYHARIKKVEPDRVLVKWSNPRWQSEEYDQWINQIHYDLRIRPRKSSQISHHPNIQYIQQQYSQQNNDNPNDVSSRVHSSLVSQMKHIDDWTYNELCEWMCSLPGISERNRKGVTNVILTDQVSGKDFNSSVTEMQDVRDAFPLITDNGVSNNGVNNIYIGLQQLRQTQQMYNIHPTISNNPPINTASAVVHDNDQKYNNQNDDDNGDGGYEYEEESVNENINMLINDKEAEIKKKENTIIKHEETIQKLQNENETLRNNENATQQMNLKQQTQINELKKQLNNENIKEYNNKLDVLTKQNNEFIEEKNKYENINNELNEKLQTFDTTQIEQNNKMEELTNKYNTLNNEKNELKQSLEDFENKNNGEEIKKKENTITKHEKTIQKLQNENETLRNNENATQQMNLKQQTQINELKKHIDSIQSELNTTKQVCYKYTQLFQRQQTVILELKNLRKEEEEKDEKQKDLSKILIDLENEMKIFKQNYNKNKLNKVFCDSPTELMQNNSNINTNINKYNNDNKGIILLCESFSDYIDNLQLFIKQISIPNVNKYKTWNLEQMCAWIMSLDNGKYVQYIKQLRNGFLKSQVLSGDLLPELTRSDLSNSPFNIDEFIIKRNLVKHFKSLLQSNIIPYNQNEGKQTQYIDK